VGRDATLTTGWYAAKNDDCPPYHIVDGYGESVNGSIVVSFQLPVFSGTLASEKCQLTTASGSAAWATAAFEGTGVCGLRSTDSPQVWPYFL
jgi:hypothetical protein